MDVKRRNQARRLALVAAICCTATTAIADQPQAKKSDSESIRRFLIDGLQPTIDAKAAVESEPTSPAVAAPAVEPSVVNEPAIAPEQPKAPVESVSKTDPSSLAEILRSKPRTIRVPNGTVEVTSKDVSDRPAKAVSAAVGPVEPPKDLASSITKLIPTKPDSRGIVAAADRFEFPSERPAPDSSSTIPTTNPTDAAEAKVTKPLAAKRQPTSADDKTADAKRLNSNPLDYRQRFHSTGDVPVAAASPVNFPAPTMSELIEADTDLRSMYEPEASFGLSDSTSGSKASWAAVPSQTPALAPAMESIAPPSSAAAIAATPDVEVPTTSPATMSPESALHVYRLRELAHAAAQNAKQSLQRGATHSARRHATEALRLTVEMQDAATSNNEHARSLTIALDAIRESKDFCGQYGSVDARALSRMVAVHETSVLKDADLETMSGLQATEAYLKVAKEALVASAGGSNDACDALVMLGVIEKRMGGDHDPHAGAVAMTMHRAAIEISDTNPVAFRELGNTFMSQGLYAQAAWSFDRSVRLRPSRSAYQSLLDASRKLGDSDTSRRCLTALNDPSLPSGIAVKTMAPEAFAASYRPNPSAMPARKASVAKPAPTPEPEATRVTNRSLFGFGRR